MHKANPCYPPINCESVKWDLKLGHIESTSGCYVCFQRMQCISTLLTYSPPTVTGAGHQRTVSTSTGCNQWLSLAKTLLKVALVGRNRSLIAHNSKCGWTIRLVVVSAWQRLDGNNRDWQSRECGGCKLIGAFCCFLCCILKLIGKVVIR